jgi:holo-[acyl-carrier protein] synthase
MDRFVKLVLRSGIDLIEITRLENIQPNIRARFLKRVYTPRELDDANGSLASLAGRFAAKEAVAKALGCGIGPVKWQEIEVLRQATGEPQLVLHGAASQLAADAGLVNWSVSISHDGTHAVAVAVAAGLVVENEPVK